MFLICRQCGIMAGVGWNHDVSIAWMRVHRIKISHTCVNRGFKWSDRRLTWRHVEASGVLDLHQTCNREVVVRSSSDGGINIKGKVHDRGPIATRSWPDRRAIVATINRNCGQIRTEIMATITGGWWPRSSCDHGHQSALNRGSNGPNFLGENPL